MEILLGIRKKIGRGFEYYEDISFIEEKRNQISVGDNDDCEFPK